MVTAPGSVNEVGRRSPRVSLPRVPRWRQRARERHRRRAGSKGADRLRKRTYHKSSYCSGSLEDWNHLQIEITKALREPNMQVTHRPLQPGEEIFGGRGILIPFNPEAIKRPAKRQQDTQEKDPRKK